MGTTQCFVAASIKQKGQFLKKSIKRKTFERKMASEVEETLKRLVGHKGVIGTVVVNKEGACIKSTLDPSTTSQYSTILGSLVSQAVVMFKEMDPSNDVTFMRVRTKKCQFMVVPDNEYL